MRPRRPSCPPSLSFSFRFAFILSIACSSPDIIVFVVDDLGIGDAGFTATTGTGLYSPNLDALASTGVILSSFYVQSACTPTRAALLTGL